MIKRSTALTILEFVITNWETLYEMSLYEIYIEINNALTDIIDSDISLRKVVKGKKFALFAEKTKVSDLVNNMKLFEDKNSIKTIHGAKGTEYQSILLYIGKENELDYIINPNINDTADDCRIYYVALSRAKDFICISASSISEDRINHLRKLDMNITEI